MTSMRERMAADGIMDEHGERLNVVNYADAEMCECEPEDAKFVIAQRPDGSLEAYEWIASGPTVN